MQVGFTAYSLTFDGQHGVELIVSYFQGVGPGVFSSRIPDDKLEDIPYTSQLMAFIWARNLNQYPVLVPSAIQFTLLVFSLLFLVVIKCETTSQKKHLLSFLRNPWGRIRRKVCHLL